MTSQQHSKLHAAVMVDAIREGVIMLYARGHLAQCSKDRILAAFDADPSVDMSSLGLFDSESVDVVRRA